ncbi:hypothetical protein HHL11_08870 [Ramlibacter sp. G-1-2-2]|uniref:Peptidase C13 n=1 Tax=Ramlibacter agri TaxID=2728837 RepID=A0A848H2W8_9BURK|nr:C13 family peptidase [Ramlibacter agri]NML43859.1 hypothetical protein [Ramlibacter agri]
MSDAAVSASQSQPAAPALPLHAWVLEGLRAGVFLRPRVAGREPAPAQLLWLALIAAAVEIALGRLEVAGSADFNLHSYLASWWGIGAMALLMWALLARDPLAADRPSGVATWFALWLMAAIPPGVAAQALSILQAQDWLPDNLDDSALFAWGVYFVLWAWTIAVALRLGWHFGLSRGRLFALAFGLVAIFGVTAWEFPDRPWLSDEPQEEEQRLVLSQEVFETQQALWQNAVDGLAPHRPGRVDVYGLVFAPDGGEDVFLRESALVTRVLEQRFDASGRVLLLVNHPTTAETLPWATPRNLQRGVEAIAQRMDREHDVLVVYLTSHGAADFQLAAANPPLDVDTISPGELRLALDNAGIRNRVIFVSACYSGGWVGPLAGDTTLVMTAADADHTSYGCGRLSDLTFFGRAVFDEQLRRTHSFEQAFAAAVPVIKQREDEAGKTDGFSNPQISVGEKIKPVLRELAQRLDALPPKP